MDKKLRLITTYSCPRECVGCCNKDLPVPPVKMSISDVINCPEDEVYITGGEPMIIDHDLLLCFVKLLKSKYKKVYIYSAECGSPAAWLNMLEYVDGITFTLHTEKDVSYFVQFNQRLEQSGLSLTYKSLRLNIFEEVCNSKELPRLVFPKWQVKIVDWIKDCPMPENETLGECILL